MGSGGESLPPASAELVSSIRSVLRAKYYITKSDATNFEKAIELLFAELHRPQDSLECLLMCARLSHHVLSVMTTMMGGAATTTTLRLRAAATTCDGSPATAASQELIEFCLNVSRRALILMSQHSNNNSNSSNNDETARAGLTCVIRDALAALYPNLRVVCRSNSSTGQQATSSLTVMMLNSLPKPSSALPMTKQQRQQRQQQQQQQALPPSIPLCDERPFMQWHGSQEELLSALSATTPMTTDDCGPQRIKQEHEKDTAHHLAGRIPFLVPASAMCSAADFADALPCPDLHLSETIAVILRSRESSSSSSSSSSKTLPRNTARRIASVNAKAIPLPSSQETAVFSTLGNLPHSCAPNCFLDQENRAIMVTTSSSISSSSTTKKNNEEETSPAANNKVRATSRRLCLSYLFAPTATSHSSSRAADDDDDAAAERNSNVLLLRSTAMRRSLLDASRHFMCSCNRCSASAPNRPHGRSFLCRACIHGTLCEVVTLAHPRPRDEEEAASASSSSCTDSTPCWHVSVRSPFAATGDNSASASAQQAPAPNDFSEHEKSWVCADCGDVASASEVSKCLRVEAALEQSVGATMSSLTANSASSSSLPKNVFEKIKGDMLECLSYLGKRHWLYLECVRAAITFFMRLATSTRFASSSTVAAALENAMRWVLKFVSAAEQQELTATTPGAVASAVALHPARVLLELQPNSPWRVHAGLIVKWVLGFTSTTSGGAGKKITPAMIDLSEKAMQLFAESDAQTTSLQSPSTPLEALCRAAEMDLDDAALLGVWETYLSERVSNLIASRGPGAAQVRAQLNLPPNV